MHGGGLKKAKKAGAGAVDFNVLPMPSFATDLERPWNILVTGIGGTGVVTIGALIGMAAHLEGKGSTVLDQTGLAQKGGAVTCHLRVGKDPSAIHAVRIAAGEADLVLGCDMVVVNDYWALSKVRPERSTVVLNTYEAMPGSFTTHPDMQFPAADIIAGVKVALGGRDPILLDATQLATALLGDAIAKGWGNRLMLRAPGETYTYAEANAQVNRIAEMLVKDYKLEPGNRVLLRGGNSIGMALAWLAVPYTRRVSALMCPSPRLVASSSPLAFRSAANWWRKQ